MQKIFRFELQNKPIEIEINDWTIQANGSAIVRYGDTRSPFYLSCFPRGKKS
jgi:polyribonucleotide nucleotidyltransferase